MRNEFEKGLPEAGDDSGYIRSSSVENVTNTHVFNKLNISANGTTQKLHPRIVPCIVDFSEK